MENPHESFFKILVHGETMDVDAVLARSLFQFDSVWRRGGFKRTETEFFPRTSGVEKHLGDGRIIDVHEQEKIACDFFEAHRDALRELAAFPGADIRILGLHRHLRITPTKTGVGVGPGQRLMRAMLDTGFKPVYYLRFDHGSD